MPDDSFYENQTIFAEEEPYHLSSRKKKTFDKDPAVKKPNTKLFVGGAVLVVVLLAVGIMMMLSNRSPQQGEPVATGTPTPIPQTESQIDAMMLELRSAIDEADPSKTELPFPPVADQIRIDNLQ